MELIELLRNVEIFEGLTAKQLKKLAYIFNERIFNAGEVVFSQGDKAKNLFLVKSGFIEVITDLPALNRKQVIRNLGQG